jgi:hypothetical protein
VKSKSEEIPLPSETDNCTSITVDDLDYFDKRKNADMVSVLVQEI